MPPQGQGSYGQGGQGSYGQAPYGQRPGGQAQGPTSGERVVDPPRGSMPPPGQGAFGQGATISQVTLTPNPAGLIEGNDPSEYPADTGWFRACCRMAPSPTEMCVTREEGNVEYLGEEVVIHGYEFPILKKMKNDGTDFLPQPPSDPNVLSAAMRNAMDQQNAKHPGKGQGGAGTGIDEPDFATDKYRGMRRGSTGDDAYEVDAARAASAQAAAARGRGNNPIPEMGLLNSSGFGDKQQPAGNVQGAPAQATMDQQSPAAAKPAEKRGKVMMDELNVLKEAWWCSYCCCTGCGCGPPAYFRCLTKWCCFRINCEQAGEAHPDNDSEGCLQCINSCCFCHFICQFPCRQGMPRCICCSERMHCCGQYKRDEKEPEHAGEAGTQPMFEYLVFEGFTPAYCCCMGCTLKKECLSCFKIGSVCCGCRFLTEEAMPDPCDGDGLCACLFTCMNCYYQSNFPPKKEMNPMFACCGKRWRKPHDLRGKIEGKKPSQQEMA